MFSIVLLWISMYLSGMLICKICGEKETSQMWRHLIGFLFLIFCQGVVFFAGQLMGWGFRYTGRVLTAVLFGASFLSAVICHKEILRGLGKIKKGSWKKISYPRHLALLLWLFLGIVLVVTTGTFINRKDAVVETTITTLMTDTMNQFRPFTRTPLEQGVILSRKIITLPFWYGILSLWTGLGAVETVWILGTLLTALCSLLAFGELGSLLFFRDFKKTWLLVVLMELLYLSGDYYVGAIGYQQLFYGYSGEVMVATIIIPGVLSILYRFFGPFLRADFPVESEKLSLWGALVELGLCFSCCLFLVPFIWGIYMVMIAVLLFVLSMIGVRLTKLQRKERV